MLDGAAFTGTGPQMIPGNNPHQPDTSDFVGFDYRFMRGGTPFHMVWRVNDSADGELPGGDRPGGRGGPRRRHDAHDGQRAAPCR